MKRHVLVLTLTLLAALGWTAGAVAASDTLYSIQVRAVPMAEKADGLATYRVLRDRGYLVYTYEAEVEGKAWLRVAVGAFESIDAAAAFGKSFAVKEEQDLFVAVAPVRIIAGDGGDFVVTPSALWTRQGGKAREILAFGDPAPRGFAAPNGIKLKLSPDGKAVAFQYGTRVYAVGLGDEEVKRLSGDKEFPAEHIYGPEPHWSPSGRYVAFHDFLEWEARTSLWVARADGGELRALVDNDQPGSNRALKAFVWHPAEDRLFFVDGSFHSSSPGGSIRSVDMEGNIRTVIERDMKGRQEHNGPLRVEGGYLHYRKWLFDENYDGPIVSDERIPLSGL